MKKLIKIILVIGLVFSNSICYAAEDRFHVINDFSKGQNSHISEFALPAFSERPSTPQTSGLVCLKTS